MSTQFVYVDSSQRYSGSSASDFTIDLKNAIYNVKAVEISQIEIPLTQYVINSNNNQINWKLNTTDYSATLTNGDYTPAELAVELDTKMDAEASGHTVSYDNQTRKFSFAHVSNIQILSSSTCSRVIGFNSDSNLSASVTGDSVWDLVPNRYFLLQSGELCASARPVLHNGGYKSVVARIQAAYDAGYIVTFQKSNLRQRVEYSEPRRLNQFVDFTLMDSSGNVVDLNGGEYSFLLEIETV